jgi:nitrate reductase gamma subunit
MTTLHQVLFIAFPYVALAICIAGFVHRYRSDRFTISSLSSQFLEGKSLFWGSVPFHFGLVVVFLGHLIAFLFPRTLLAWNGHPVRLIILECVGLAFALSMLVGLTLLIYRRVTNARIRAVTTRMDMVVEGLLLVQILLGIWTALGFRWGSSWFAADLTPYLWSVLTFQPDISAVSAMPTVIQMHIVGAYVLVLLIPFSRLAHFLVAPFHYIMRPFQQVIWNWDRRKVRAPETAWTHTRPRNT